MKRRVLPVLVIYKCQMTDAVAYQTVIRGSGLSEWVVYDNSPKDYHQEKVIPEGVHYYRDVNNGGLSKAYNKGADIAEQLGYEWILLLDQDTRFPEGAYESYCRAVETSEAMLCAPQVVLSDRSPFSPAHNSWMGMRPVVLKEGVYSLNDYAVINSGCCVPVSLFKSVGGYNEKVRLDFTDYQFQSRLKCVESRFRLLPMVLEQDFSNDETDPLRLMNRYELYLDSASNCEFHGLKDRLQFQLQVFKHTLALTIRTRSGKFIANYFKKYLF